MAETKDLPYDCDIDQFNDPEVQREYERWCAWVELKRLEELEQEELNQQKETNHE